MNKNFVEIIEAAKKGDSFAFEALYNMTKDSAFFVANSITHNLEDSKDILQESYVKAFSSLDTLKDPRCFDSWLNKIVANNSKNYIVKRKPILFADEEIGEEILSQYEETSLEYIPHEAIDLDETSRLIMEIINNLPEDQRLCILMYYYQDMGTAEIASTLDLKKNNVLQKLHTARKAIKNGVKKLEKTGIKLYSIAPLAFILPSVFKNVAEMSSMSLSASVYESVGTTIVSNTASASASATVSGTVGSGSVGVFSICTSKVIALSLSAVLIGGGVGFIYSINENNNDDSNIIDNRLFVEYDEVSKDNQETSTLPDNRKKKLSNESSDEENSETRVVEYPEESSEAEENSHSETSETEPDKPEEPDENPIPTDKKIIPVNIPQVVNAKNDKISENLSQVQDENTSEITDNEVKDFDYYVLENGDIEITRYNGNQTDLVIPSTIDDKKVMSIGDDAFRNNSSIKSITIPEGVTEIGNYTFNDCTALKSISIPNSVEDFGGDVFTGCTSLESITAPAYVYDMFSLLSYNQFQGFKSIKNITITSDLWGLDYGFDEYTSLENMTILDGVEYIGSCAFCDCTSLKSITIPDSVTVVGFEVFKGCTSLQDITAPAIIYKHIKEDDYYIEDDDGNQLNYLVDSIKNVTITGNVENIEDSMFAGYNSIESITIPYGVKYIGDYAFYGCTSLKNVIIPDSVTSIGIEIFSGCTSLQNITAPYIVYDKYSFSELNSLKSITITDNIDNINYDIFNNYTSLESINISNDNEYYSSVDGVVFNKDKTEILIYPSGKADTPYTIPDGVTTIRDSIFLHCTLLKHLIIPDSVTEIRAGAFIWLSSLESITIPASVKDIEFETFYGCDNLRIIYGKEGSVAEEYANNIGIKFVAI